MTLSLLETDGWLADRVDIAKELYVDMRDVWILVNKAGLQFGSQQHEENACTVNSYTDMPI
jgi:hypothetical protein